MGPIPEAMSNRGPNMIDQQGQARAGAPDLGTGMGRMLTSRELAQRQHYVDPGAGATNDPENGLGRMNQGPKWTSVQQRDMEAEGLPRWINSATGPAVPYSAPSELKDRMVMRKAIHEAAGREIKQGGAENAVVRTDPIGDDEIAYLKSMRDQAELAKFDDYVETLIDPRMPGNMKWLMEVYPDYVSRRLQQAHTDYEYALRNQMVDTWGINTFDDLHFKYLVDQGKISGPSLKQDTMPLDSSYTPGWLSPFNFQSPDTGSGMRLPYASAKHGARPADINSWAISRDNRPLGKGNDYSSLAKGMYDNKEARTDHVRGSFSNLFKATER